MQPQNVKPSILQQKLDVKITRIIPQSSRIELTLAPYIIITSESKKANQIINTLKDIQKEQLEHQLKQKKEIDEDIENLYQKQKQKPFLKRVRKEGDKIEVLICRDNCQNKQSILKRLQNLNLIEKIQIKQLPHEAPITKAQFQQWAKIWPINFILHEVAKEIPHTQGSKNLLASLFRDPQAKDQFYLLDQKGEKILLSNSGSCKEFTIAHPIMQLLKSWSLCDQFLSKPQKYYYLTGLKMFIRKQICGMCSMALVHSRLSTIYMVYKIPPVMDNIMACRKLNHQIKMFYLQ